jgi:hypothetical protein
MRAPLSREEALERLSRRLYEKFEHIDPTGEEWEDIEDQTRDMYRSATRHLLEAPRDVLRAVLGYTFSGNDIMNL